MRIGNAASRPVPARRVRRADGRARTRRATPGSTPTRTRGGSRSRCWSYLETVWSRARRGHLGGPRRAPPLRALEGHGLGRVRPRRAGRRALRRTTGRSSAGGSCATTVHREVCERGFDAERGTFTQSYGSRDARRRAADDPARRLPPARRPARGRHGRGDPARADARRLRAALRLAAAADDGLPPGEGAFLPCSFWLADCLRLLGRLDEARALFERLAGARATTSGCSPRSTTRALGRQLGNFPQAFTHVGLVNTALNLDRATEAGPAHRRAQTAEAS